MPAAIVPRAVPAFNSPPATPATGVHEFKLIERINTKAQRGTIFLNFIQIKRFVDSVIT